ncbi:D-amino acid dehydrogenase [Wohlfahrtiimonas chitiniclastica]|uniref:D-amino acid dehydrogenase n=1 Tax=Wohlfahrtiimonas chitiniclastica TaxID=400946 RepID=A0AB35BYU2_9GAMM|nr:D-amino acid dehydrogenase [Wohlfahrtiimonas chitiniclastica]MBS7825002.1 D-amino acid dehydrogenase [Wohlfahrtiimonas chitiniclastica]MBS7840607.1 D-amino acid dehydrogenase [Wohlfahrtiimonas chitiniclastica]
MEKSITIIGGGVIGLSLAYALIKDGQKVILLDQADGIGTGASYANGAQLSYRYVSPLADQGVILQGLKWLGQSDSPLNLRIKPSLTQWQWLWQFARACSRKTNQINGAHILRLSLLSQSVLTDWREQDALDDFCWQRSGKMIIHRTQKDFDQAAAGIDPKFQSILTPDEIVQKEPSLAHIRDQLSGAIYAPNDETADAYLYCQALLNKLNASPKFTLHTQTRVEDIFQQKGMVTHIVTNHGSMSVDEVVVAAGNGARELMTPLGIELPIYPLKGYSLTLPFPQESNCVPTTSVTDYGHKTVYAKLGDRLRIAAMVDIGYDNGMRDNRIRALKNIVQQTFPNLYGVESADVWAGLRPSTPKGPPIIGQTHYHNLWLNVGHGSLGFTLAAGSAAVLSQLIGHKSSPIDLTGLTL